MATTTLDAYDRWTLTYLGSVASDQNAPLDIGTHLLAAYERAYVEWDISTLDFNSIDSVVVRYFIKTPQLGAYNFRIQEPLLQPSTVNHSDSDELLALWQAAGDIVADPIAKAPDETFVTAELNAAGLIAALDAGQSWYAVYFRSQTENTSANRIMAISRTYSWLNLTVVGSRLAAADTRLSDFPEYRNTALGRSVTLSGVNTDGADQIQWQIFLSEQDETAIATTATPFPVTITTDATGTVADYANVIASEMGSMAIWLPPYQNFKYRVRRLTSGAWGSWSSFKSFTSPGYMNSFETYQQLSGETINPTIIT